MKKIMILVDNMPLKEAKCIKKISTPRHEKDDLLIQVTA
jgi:hypothetical protein